MDDEDYQKHMEIVKIALRGEFESGDKLALLDCIRWCDEYGLHLPNWALETLSRVAGLYLSRKKDTLDEALFGSKVRMGRLARPATARRVSRSDQFIYDTVVALRRRGYKGDSLYERAQELLRTMYLDDDNRLIFMKDLARQVPKVETIKKKCEKLNKKGVRPSGWAHLIPMMVDLHGNKHNE